MRGQRREVGGLICFTYEGAPGDWCWTYHTTGDGLVARLSGRQDGGSVRLVPGAAPLTCPDEVPNA